VVEMGGYAWLRQSMAGLRCVFSARLRCARALWAVTGHLPESEAGVGGKAMESGALGSGAAGMGDGA
jgi:hypothetical protein